MGNLSLRLLVVAGIGLPGCAPSPEKEVPNDTDSEVETPPTYVPTDRNAKEDRGPGRCIAVNAAGTVLGVDADEVPFTVAVDGTRTRLPRFGDKATVGLVIDDGGVVSGYSDSLDGRVAIEFRGGAWQEVAGVGGGAAVLALAPGGARGGLVNDASGLRGFILEPDGSPRTLDLPDDLASAVYGLTDDRYVGIVEASNGATHAFVFEAGSLVDLGTLGGTNSTALAVSADGSVVGVSERSDGAVHAFVRRAGADEIEDLGRHPDALGSDARGIDAAGRIVLNQQFEDGTSRPQVMGTGGDVVDLLPVAAGTPYLSAHVAAVSPHGIAVGWGIPKGADKDPLRCLVWNLNQVGVP